MPEMIIKPVILDVDPGIDDMVALLASFGSPKFDVKAVGACHGNIPVEMGHRNLGRILQLIGRDDLVPGLGTARPLLATHSTPIHDIHGEDGLGNAASLLPDEISPAINAVTLYAKTLIESPEPVTIIALAPLTNIAALLITYPELKPKIERIVLMGGGDGRGNTSSIAEFNVACDPEAAERVFNDEVPITMIGFDLTRTVRFGREWLDELAAGGRVSQVASQVAEYYLEIHEARGREGMPVHDAVAAALAAEPQLGEYVETAVYVDCGLSAARGATVLTRDGFRVGRAQVLHAVDVDRRALAAWVTSSIARLDGLSSE